MRRPTTLSAIHASASSVSPSVKPASSSSPRPISPVTRPSTVTRARETRCRTMRISAGPPPPPPWAARRSQAAGSRRARPRRRRTPGARPPPGSRSGPSCGRKLSKKVRGHCQSASAGRAMRARGVMETTSSPASCIIRGTPRAHVRVAAAVAPRGDDRGDHAVDGGVFRGDLERGVVRVVVHHQPPAAPERPRGPGDDGFRPADEGEHPAGVRAVEALRRKAQVLDVLHLHAHVGDAVRRGARLQVRHEARRHVHAHHASSLPRPAAPGPAWRSPARSRGPGCGPPARSRPAPTRRRPRASTPGAESPGGAARRRRCPAGTRSLRASSGGGGVRAGRYTAARRGQTAGRSRRSWSWRTVHEIAHQVVPATCIQRRADHPAIRIPLQKTRMALYRILPFTPFPAAHGIVPRRPPRQPPLTTAPFQRRGGGETARENSANSANSA